MNKLSNLTAVIAEHYPADFMVVKFFYDEHFKFSAPDYKARVSFKDRTIAGDGVTVWDYSFNGETLTISDQYGDAITMPRFDRPTFSDGPWRESRAVFNDRATHAEWVTGCGQKSEYVVGGLSEIEIMRLQMGW